MAGLASPRPMSTIGTQRGQNFLCDSVTVPLFLLSPTKRERENREKNARGGITARFKGTKGTLRILPESLTFPCSRADRDKGTQGDKGEQERAKSHTERIH